MIYRCRFSCGLSEFLQCVLAQDAPTLFGNEANAFDYSVIHLNTIRYDFAFNSLFVDLRLGEVDLKAGEKIKIYLNDILLANPDIPSLRWLLWSQEFLVKSIHKEVGNSLTVLNVSVPL